MEDQKNFQELREIFLSFDTSQDGLLELTEIKNGLQEVFGDIQLSLFQHILQELD